MSSAKLDFYKNYNMRDLIKVAVFSAMEHTQLRPTLIYDGKEDAFVKEIRSLGAAVVLHRSALYNAFAAHAQSDYNFLHLMAGAFLRFEVPAVELVDQFVLYTDCDVLFLRHPDFGPALPEVFGATSQFATDPSQDMNSGVMLMNVVALRGLMPELQAFTRKSLHLGLDQEILKAFFGADYLVLDRSLNWKPYWGWNPAAQIVHFHGPKPATVREYLVNGEFPDNKPWAELLTWNREGYEAYARLWYLHYERMSLNGIRVAHDTSTGCSY